MIKYTIVHLECPYQSRYNKISISFDEYPKQYLRRIEFVDCLSSSFLRVGAKVNKPESNSGRKIHMMLPAEYSWMNDIEKEFVAMYLDNQETLTEKFPNAMSSLVTVALPHRNDSQFKTPSQYIHEKGIDSKKHLNLIEEIIQDKIGLWCWLCTFSQYIEDVPEVTECATA